MTATPPPTATNRDLGAESLTVAYREAKQAFFNHPARQLLVPVEHAISAPIPTRRCGLPGLAAYAGPARRQPGQPVQLETPDRWWVVGLRRPDLLTYALVAAMPFAESVPEGPAELPPSERTIAQAKDDLFVLDQLMVTATSAFFADHDAEPTLSQDLLGALFTSQPPEIEAWYVGLAPDFFAWLRP